MSDCGVCLYCDADDIAFDITTEYIVPEKPVRCSSCRRTSREGENYEYAILHMGDEEAEVDEDGNYLNDDRWDDKYWTCPICAEVGEAFFCNGRVYGVDVWEYFYESDAFENLNTSCFDRLKTPEAKAELRRRWMEYKGMNHE